MKDEVLDCGGEVAFVVAQLLVGEVERDEGRKGEAQMKIRLDRHMAGRAIVGKEIKETLVGGVRSSGRDRSPSVGYGVSGERQDLGTTGRLFKTPPIDRIPVGVQKEIMEVSTVGVMMDVISKKDLWIRIRKSAKVDYTDYLDFTASTFG